jgi:predicted alpha/beta hydrolase family esterase
MPRAIIIHGWDNSPEDNWFPWLKQQLVERGWDVVVPAMPDTEVPRIQPWVAAVAAAVGNPDEQTYLVGHSIGCQTILRYVAGLPVGQKIGGAVLVAPFLRLDPNGVEYADDEKAIVGPWIDPQLNLAAPRLRFIHGSVAIFSDNDYWVSATYNEPRFRQELGAQTIILPNRGHFMERDGVTELPEALESILKLAGSQ